MIELVDFDTAKLLEEKGFDLPVVNFYNEQKALHQVYNMSVPENMNRIKTSEWYKHNVMYSAPTIAQVVMWLYDRHEVWIEVSLTDNSRHYYFDYTIITSKDRDYNDEDCFDSAKRFYDDDKHNKPTEAYVEAIKYCLKKLTWQTRKN